MQFNLISRERAFEVEARGKSLHPDQFHRIHPAGSNSPRDSTNMLTAKVENNYE